MNQRGVRERERERKKEKGEVGMERLLQRKDVYVGSEHLCLVRPWGKTRDWGRAEKIVVDS